MTETYTHQMQSTLTKLEEQLNSIKNAQNELNEMIKKINETSLISQKEITEIKGNMDKISVYHTKLLSMKATMSMLSGRCRQLSTRAEKLEKIKKDYLSQVEDIKRIEKEKDQNMAAPSVAKVSNSNKKVIPKTVKKKVKARQVALDDKEDGLDWKPQKKK